MKKMLKLMPHGQAYVTILDNGTAVLTSYEMEAATLTPDAWLTVKEWSSPTIRRHVVAFIDEYVYHINSRKEQDRARTESYQTAKALYEMNVSMNIETGEIIDL